MSSRFLTRVSLFSVIVLMLAVVPAFSQATSSGSVVGQVTDQSGGVIPGASVSLTDTGTKAVIKTSANEVGRYVFVNVPSGRFILSVNQTGFTQSNTSGVDVTIGATVTINVQLKIGKTTETVTVEAATIAELRTTSATVGNTIDSAAMQNLPNLGRDVTTLTTLQPGVTAGGAAAGVVTDQNTYSLDGGNNTDDMAGTTTTYQTNFVGNGGTQTNGAVSGVLPTPIE